MPRFTPTCVGNTITVSHITPCEIGSPPRVWGILFRSSKPKTIFPVHPHVCGEYHHKHQYVSLFCRFTPTCVGNTTRGLHTADYNCGSPPRVWGIPYTSKNLGR